MCHKQYLSDLLSGKRSSRFQSDGPTNIQPSDANPSFKSASQAGHTDENLNQKLAMLTLEDRPNYVPPLPSVSSEPHEKADMLIAYATVKGIITLKNR